MIKLLLSFPAILIGILSAIIFILKPLKDLWFPSDISHNEIDNIIDNFKN